MNEKNYKKRLDFQQKIISRKSEEIDELKAENEKLKLELQEKIDLINSVEPMRKELEQNVEEIKKYKKQYKSLVQELRKMKEIMNKEVYKGRWILVKLLIR